MEAAPRPDRPFQFSLAMLLVGVTWLCVFIGVERATAEAPYNRLAVGLVAWGAIASAIVMVRDLRIRLGRSYLAVIGLLFAIWLGMHVSRVIGGEDLPEIHGANRPNVVPRSRYP